MLLYLNSLSEGSYKHHPITNYFFSHFDSKKYTIESNEEIKNIISSVYFLNYFQIGLHIVLNREKLIYQFGSVMETMDYERFHDFLDVYLCINQ